MACAPRRRGCSVSSREPPSARHRPGAQPGGQVTSSPQGHRSRRRRQDGGKGVAAPSLFAYHYLSPYSTALCRLPPGPSTLSRCMLPPMAHPGDPEPHHRARTTTRRQAKPPQAAPKDAAETTELPRVGAEQGHSEAAAGRAMRQEAEAPEGGRGDHHELQGSEVAESVTGRDRDGQPPLLPSRSLPGSLRGAERKREATARAWSRAWSWYRTAASARAL